MRLSGTWASHAQTAVMDHFGILVIGIEFRSTLGVQFKATGRRVERCHLAFFDAGSFLDFIDSRKR